MNASPNRVQRLPKDYGIAVRYFFSLAEFEVLDVACGDEIANSDIGKTFGEEAVVFIGNTVDGRTWRVICNDPALNGCWIAAV